MNLIGLFSCLPCLWLLIWTSQGSPCVFNIIAFCMWRRSLVFTWLLALWGAVGAALGFCPSAPGEQFRRKLLHLCSIRETGRRERLIHGSAVGLLEDPEDDKRGLLWFESYCGCLEHPALLLQSRSGEVCLEQKAFLFLLMYGEENLGCIFLHSRVKPPDSVGLDISATLLFPP